MSEFHTDAGAAGRRHSELPPELRLLAQSILDRLDPALGLVAARVAAGSPGKCEQVWCPVCALAALAAGEQHPMLTVIAEHSVALMAVVRAMLETVETRPGSGGESPEPPPPPSGPVPPSPEGDPPPSAPGHYQHIPVTVED